MICCDFYKYDTFQTYKQLRFTLINWQIQRNRKVHNTVFILISFGWCQSLFTCRKISLMLECIRHLYREEFEDSNADFVKVREITRISRAYVHDKTRARWDGITHGTLPKKFARKQRRKGICSSNLKGLFYCLLLSAHRIVSNEIWRKICLFNCESI